MTVSRPSLAAIKHFRGWSALRHRNYRLFFGGQLVSLIGTWMQAVAQGWLVLQLTGEPFWLGVVAAAQFGPVLVLGLFGGLIADGLPKRQTLVVTQAIAMVLAFALFGLTATHVVEVWHVVGLALLLGVVNSIDMPTRQSFVVEMVGRDDVPNAIALNSAVFNGARIVGPAIAGITIGLTDISVAFLVNGITFLAVIGGYVLMDATALRTPPQLARPSSFRGVLTDVAEGLRYVRRTPIVLMPVLVLGLVSTFGMNFNVIIPALARDVLDVGASGYGFLMAATGIGSFGVAMAIAFGRRVRPAFIGLGGALLGLAEIVLAMSGWFELSLLAMFLVGLGGIGMAATANTLIQLNVPDQLRGRVLGVYTMVFAGSTPLGGLLAGALASAFSVPVSIAFGGVASLISGIAGYAWYRRIRSSTAIAEAAAERVAAAAPSRAAAAVIPVAAPVDTA
ncbi:MAG TPA: MFS transporter, partial [Candidatus Limnocylindrales bacterium]|nr:MFS transporter [Candidatus Limnocylindrales bacterium]